ncbi:MAG TPA: CBS domain-containing protein [Polyangia bacterium]|nr:CBS domain-containing protein [Polyangia bacterium]
MMTSPVHTLEPGDTLNCAAKLMRDHAVGCVPVVDIDAGGAIVGILTDRDIALAAYEWGEALWKLPVRQSMRAPVHVCHADDDIDFAAHTMREHRLRRLPVVDAANRPIGMISLDDFAWASRQPILDPTPGLTSDELGGLYDATSGRSKHRRSEKR